MPKPYALIISTQYDHICHSKYNMIYIDRKKPDMYLKGSYNSDMLHMMRMMYIIISYHFQS
jgi:hypothetical protein